MMMMVMMLSLEPVIEEEKEIIINGAIAQLGERYAGSVEVIGSNPFSSTIFFLGTGLSSWPLFKTCCQEYGLEDTSFVKIIYFALTESNVLKKNFNKEMIVRRSK